MIHCILIDTDIDDRLKEFSAKLPHDMKIVSMVTSEKYLFLMVEKKENSHSRGAQNLLLEEIYKRGQQKP